MKNSKIVFHFFYIVIFFSLSSKLQESRIGMCKHSLQNNLFFLIIPLCPVFLDSKSGENIQVAPGERYGPGIQERDAPAVRPTSLRPNCTPCCCRLSTLDSRRVDSHHASRRGKGPRGDRRAPCCSIDRALCLNHMSL